MPGRVNERLDNYSFTKELVTYENISFPIMVDDQNSIKID